MVRPSARGNHKIEEDDGGANENDGDGMAQSPKSADESGFREGALAAHDGGDRDDVVGIRGMAHAKEKPDGENGQSADHREPVYTNIRVQDR